MLNSRNQVYNNLNIEKELQNNPLSLCVSKHRVGEEPSSSLLVITIASQVHGSDDADAGLPQTAWEIVRVIVIIDWTGNIYLSPVVHVYSVQKLIIPMASADSFAPRRCDSWRNGN